MVVPGIALLCEESITLFKHRGPASEELFSVLAFRAFLVTSSGTSWSISLLSPLAEEEATQRLHEEQEINVFPLRLPAL